MPAMYLARASRARNSRIGMLAMYLARAASARNSRKARKAAVARVATVRIIGRIVQASSGAGCGIGATGAGCGIGATGVTSGVTNAGAITTGATTRRWTFM